MSESVQQKEVSVKPNPVRELSAHPAPGGVQLAWKAPLEGVGIASASRFFVMRFGVDDAGQRAFHKTVFVGPSARSYRDEGVAPGRYVYLVGGIAPTGSGPASEAHVTVGR